MYMCGAQAHSYKSDIALAGCVITYHIEAILQRYNVHIKPQTGLISDL